MFQSKDPQILPSKAGKPGLVMTSLVVILLLTLVAYMAVIDCRYLPTRADERDVEVLQDIIKNVSS